MAAERITIRGIGGSVTVAVGGTSSVVVELSELHRGSKRIAKVRVHNSDLDEVIAALQTQREATGSWTATTK